MTNWQVSARWTGVLLLLGAAVAIVGCFLPFVVLTEDRARLTSSGFDADYGTSNQGPSLVVIAAVAALVGVMTVSRLGWLGLQVLGVLAGFAGLFWSVPLLLRAGEDEESRYEDTLRSVVGETGAGVYLQIAAFAVVLVGAFAGLFTQRPRAVARHA